MASQTNGRVTVYDDGRVLIRSANEPRAEDDDDDERTPVETPYARRQPDAEEKS